MEKYNGWSNVFTWIVSLWLSNSEGDEEYIVSDLLPQAIESAKEDKRGEYGDLVVVKKRTKTYLADSLKEYIEEVNEEIVSQSSMTSDLLGHAIAFVDWHEIALHYVDDNTDDGDFEIKEEESALDEDPTTSDAYFVTPGGSPGGLYIVSQYQKVLHESPEYDETIAFVRNHADNEKFWPNAYFVSDHGNVSPLVY